MRIKYYAIVLIILLNLIVGNLFGQICSASNSKGCGHYHYGDITGIKVYDNSILEYSSVLIYKDSGFSCGSGSSSNTLINSGKPITMYSAGSYSVSLNATDSGYNFRTIAGLWIDLNMNGVFESSECLDKPELNLDLAFQLPCLTTFGKTLMRVRSTASSEVLTDTNGCGTLNIPGTIFDMEVNLVKDTAPVANFAIDTGTKYVKNRVGFEVKNYTNKYKYFWSAAGSINPSSNAAPFMYNSWKSADTYDVKMVADYCGIKDSITKSIIIVAPLVVPDGIFESDFNSTEIYYNIQFFDKSNNGPYNWDWQLISPDSNIYTSSQKNPVFTLDGIGKFTACRRAKNDVGWGSWYCKNVWCIPPPEHFMGANHSADWDSGFLFDNGGPNLHYGNNRTPKTDYFLIKTHSIGAELTIQELRLADTGDRLKVYQGEGDTGLALHPTGGFTKGNFSSTPISLISKTGIFYITFESDGSGTDSGFVISWKPLNDHEIKGHVYYDKDSNNKFDPAKDAGFEKFGLKVGSYKYSLNNTDGLYRFLSDTVQKIITPLVPAGWKVSYPATGKDTWNLKRTGNIDFAFRIDKSNPRTDLENKMTPRDGFSAKRGWESYLYIDNTNIGNTKIDSIQCILKANRKLAYLKIPYYNYQATDTSLLFGIGKLDVVKNERFEVAYKVLAADSGDLGFRCNCFPVNKKDNDSSNNYSEWKGRITNAHDPNDKQVSEAENMQERNPVLKYFVRFQNTGTAPATDVVVRDTLSEFLDTNAIQLISSSYSCSLEQQGRVLAFKFIGINLQDSGHNEPLSHGYIYYSAKPISGLEPYKKIANTAYIYFDAEAPVKTNTTTNQWAPEPLIRLKGRQFDTVDICGVYYDSGALASDDFDGNINSKIKVTGKVSYSAMQTDTLVYSVTPSYGITKSVIRYVYNTDRVRPHILRDGKKIVHQMVVNVPIKSVFTDSVYADDSCRGKIAVGITPGFNGPVNPIIRAIYPIAYNAMDSAGNKAVEDGYEIWYKVDDFIPPVINLNTDDTVCHQINTPYNSIPVSVSDNYYTPDKISVTKQGTVDPFTLGLYAETFIATDESGNSSSKTRYVMVKDCAAGVDDISDLEITLYPNPACSAFTLILHGHAEGPISILLYNANGDLVQSTQEKTDPGMLVINAEALTPGMYLVRVSANNQAVQRKILINK